MIQFYSAVIGIFILFSCRTTVNVQPPLTETSVPELPKSSISTLVLPIDIDIKEYTSLAEKQVPNKFNGGEHPCDGISFDYQFNRGPFQFTGTGQELITRLDGSYWIKMNYCAKCTDLLSEKPVCAVPKIPFSCGVGEPMRKMKLAFKSSFELTENYGIKTKTTVEEVKPLDPCEVTVFQYDATDQLVTEVKKALNGVTKDMDKELAKMNFKSDVNEAWKMASEAIPVPGYGTFYLQPSAIKMTQPTLIGTRLTTTVQLEVSPLFTQHEQINRPKPLPALQLAKADKKVNDTMQVHFDLLLNYDSLTRISNAYIKGTKIPYKKKEIVIDSVAIFGAKNNRLLFQVNFSGSANGTIFLEGSPTYDAEKERILLEAIDYDINTRNVLIQTASWMFDDKILNELQKAANYDIGPLKKDMLKDLNKQLNYSIYGYQLKSNIHDAQVERLLPLENQLMIRLLIKGTSKLMN